VAGGGALPFEHPLLQYLEAKERQEATLPVAEAEAVSSFLRVRITLLVVVVYVAYWVVYGSLASSALVSPP